MLKSAGNVCTLFSLLEADTPGRAQHRAALKTAAMWEGGGKKIVREEIDARPAATCCVDRSQMDLAGTNVLCLEGETSSSSVL